MIGQTFDGSSTVSTRPPLVGFVENRITSSLCSLLQTISDFLWRRDVCTRKFGESNPFELNEAENCVWIVAAKPDVLRWTPCAGPKMGWYLLWV